MTPHHHQARDADARARPARGSPALPGRVGIVGADALGMQLATNLLDAGVPVTLFAADFAAEPPAPGRRMPLLSVTANLHHLKDCDLILEAVPSGTGGELFQRLGEFLKPGAVLMTTAAHPGASYIAGFSRRPDGVPGAAGDGAAPAWTAWQFVCRSGTTADTLAAALALARELCTAARIGEAIGEADAGPAFRPAAGAGRTAALPARSPLPA